MILPRDKTSKGSESSYITQEKIKELNFDNLNPYFRLISDAKFGQKWKIWPKMAKYGQKTHFFKWDNFLKNSKQVSTRLHTFLEHSGGFAIFSDLPHAKMPKFPTVH